MDRQIIWNNICRELLTTQSNLFCELDQIYRFKELILIAEENGFGYGESYLEEDYFAMSFGCKDGQPETHGNYIITPGRLRLKINTGPRVLKFKDFGLELLTEIEEIEKPVKRKYTKFADARDYQRIVEKKYLQLFYDNVLIKYIETKPNPWGKTKSERSEDRGISKSVRFDVLKRDKFKCVACGASPAKDENVQLEIDHIIPWSKGGTNDDSNLQTLCHKCNRGKRDTLM